MSWPVIVPIFFFQEFASVSAVLALAYRDGYNLLILHVLWVVATVVDISLGYFLGRYLGELVFKNSRFGHVLERWAKKFEDRVGKSGQSFSLMLLGFVLSPYLAGFIVAWMELSFNDVLLFVALGDILWYLFAWAAVIGLTAAVPNMEVFIIVVICIAIALSLAFRRLRKKVF
jgi:membrane protein YqaA with SNARE-associated domain